MKKANKKWFTITIFSLLLAFGLQTAVLANEAMPFNHWSNTGTFRLNNTSNWTGGATGAAGNPIIRSQKSTNGNNWDVHTISKTMTTSPVARMVNSNNAVRSNNLTTPGTGRTAVGTGNTGSPGFVYFLQVRASLNQVANNQSIRLQFRAR